MSDIEDILEACRLYKEAETRLKEERDNLGWTLIRVHKNINVSRLAELTDIKRPSIYWLMRRLRTITNGNENAAA